MSATRDEAPDELALIGYEKLVSHGFALPCFGQVSGANTVYVARPMVPGDPVTKIECFEVYDPEQLQLLPAGASHIAARSGGPWIDVFLWDGEVYVGTKPEIWASVAQVRDDIAAKAPLSLLDLVEGVAGVPTGPAARAAFAWLASRAGTAAASAWRTDTYFRGIALRGLRRRFGATAGTGLDWRALQDVALHQDNTKLFLRLPIAVVRLARISPIDCGELRKAAQEFRLNLWIIPPLAQWTKKLTPSDAQRKRTGNQRGSITLVRGQNQINAQSYFRHEFFGSAEWTNETTRTGQQRESITIPVQIDFLGNDLGLIRLIVTYAPNREAAQANYTSLLHLGPLAAHFSAEDVTGKYLVLDRRADGTYALSINRGSGTSSLFSE